MQRSTDKVSLLFTNAFSFICRKSIIVSVLVLLLFAEFNLSAQNTAYTHGQINSVINSEIPGSNNIVTVSGLQYTLWDFNSSFANLRSDTMYVMLFDSSYTYYFGMKIIPPTTIFSTLAHTPAIDSINPPFPYPYYYGSGYYRCVVSSFKGRFDTIHFKPQVR
jgi:hypothetical protein